MSTDPAMLEFVEVTIKCLICKKIFQLKVKSKDLQRYWKGDYIQSCFPYLSAGERELFISQTCEDCFDKAFPE